MASTPSPWPSPSGRGYPVGGVMVKGAYAAFTLMELLVVIAIIGILTAVSLPALKGIMRSDIMAAANRQLQDDIAYARRLAVRNRSTVYMVFMPSCDETWPRSFSGHCNSLPALERDRAQELLGMQQVGYAMFSFRRVGDQPGQNNPIYWRDWTALPEGVYIPRWKYYAGTGGVPGFQRVAVNFPEATSPTYPLPCIAFNYLGQTVRFDAAGNPLNVSQDEIIPLARGGVVFAKEAADPDKYAWTAPQIVENPPGSSITQSNHIRIEWMTGRTKIIRPEIQ